jgi:asparagine N-glycosylation enzyme membrane subunit Stt3
MDRSILKLVPGDVWAALAVAVMVLILAAYDHSPLLIVVLAATAVYITIQDTPYDRTGANVYSASCILR